MGKLDDLRRLAGGNVDESMGVGRPARERTGAAPGASAPARWQGVSKSRNAAEIPIARIERDPAQPREEFDEESLARLAESLRTRGQLQPIRVRWDEGRGVYVILCGERRWRAAQQAGLATLSCIVVDGDLDEGELLSIQLVENCLREDLRPIEQARAFRTLMERNGWSISQVARELAIDHSSISRALALLDLPGPVQDLVEQGRLAPATGYEVSKLPDSTEQQALAERVVSENLSRSETIEAVRQSSARSPRPGAKGRGGSRSRKPSTRLFRFPNGRVTVELKRESGDEAIRALLVEALAQLDAALEPRESSAA